MAPERHPVLPEEEERPQEATAAGVEEEVPQRGAWGTSRVCIHTWGS